MLLNFVNFTLTINVKTKISYLACLDKKIIVNFLNNYINKAHAPALFVSTKNVYPEGLTDDDIYCSALGVNPCFIPDSKIQSNTTYYLWIFCFENC